MDRVILLADDHFTVRKSLRTVIKEHTGLTNVDEASTCSEILNFLKKKHYTHAILDLGLSDGTTLEIIPTIRNIYPDLRVMIYSVQTEELYENALAKYGIQDFVSKSASEDDAIPAIRRFIDNEAPRRPLKRIDKTSSLMNLSPRELEVTHHLLRGSSVTQIGASLNIKQSSVSTIKSRIFEKCQVGSILDLERLISTHSHLERRGKR